MRISSRARLVRERIVESWNRSHPDEESQVELLWEVLFLSLDSLLEDVMDLPSRRRKILGEGATQAALSVYKCSQINDDDVERVARTVYSAYWSANSRKSWVSATRDFAYRRQYFTLFLFVGVVAIALVFVPAPILEEHFSDDELVLLLAICLILIELYKQSFRLMVRFAAWVVEFWRVLCASVLLSSLLWFPSEEHFRHYIKTYRIDTWTLGSMSLRGVDVADCVRSALLILFIALLVRVLHSALMLAFFRLGPGEPRSVVTSSEMILSFLLLARVSQTAYRPAHSDYVPNWVKDELSSAGPTGEDEEDDEDDSGKEDEESGLFPYVSTINRGLIIQTLERLARLAEGPWRRSLTAKDPEADLATANVAAGIAASARRWKAIAATGGDHQPDMSHSFEQALVDAADGRWSQLATDFSSAELIGRRILRLGRRFLAVALVAGAAITVAANPFDWSIAAGGPIVNSVALVFIGMLALAIDPTLGDRVSNAAKLIGNLNAKK